MTWAAPAPDHIRQYRIEHQLTQKKLSEYAHVSITAIKAWERGDYPPSQQAWLLICYETKARELGYSSLDALLPV